LLLLIAASPARADWTLAAYLGSSFTQPATLTLVRGSASTRIPDVHFAAKPFVSPPYYGYRVGWRGRGALSVEAELIHVKVFARRADLPAAVERFSISHGLNLVLGNVTKMPSRIVLRYVSMFIAHDGPVAPHWIRSIGHG